MKEVWSSGGKEGENQHAKLRSCHTTHSFLWPHPLICIIAVLLTSAIAASFNPSCWFAVIWKTFTTKAYVYIIAEFRPMAPSPWDNQLLLHWCKCLFWVTPRSHPSPSVSYLLEVLFILNARVSELPLCVQDSRQGRAIHHVQLCRPESEQRSNNYLMMSTQSHRQVPTRWDLMVEYGTMALHTGTHAVTA